MAVVTFGIGFTATARKVIAADGHRIGAASIIGRVTDAALIVDTFIVSAWTIGAFEVVTAAAAREVVATDGRRRIVTTRIIGGVTELAFARDAFVEIARSRDTFTVITAGAADEVVTTDGRRCNVAARVITRVAGLALARHALPVAAFAVIGTRPANEAGRITNRCSRVTALVIGRITGAARIVDALATGVRTLGVIPAAAAGEVVANGCISSAVGVVGRVAELASARPDALGPTRVSGAFAVGHTATTSGGLVGVANRLVTVDVAIVSIAALTALASDAERLAARTGGSATACTGSVGTTVGGQQIAARFAVHAGAIGRCRYTIGHCAAAQAAQIAAILGGRVTDFAASADALAAVAFAVVDATAAVFQAGVANRRIASATGVIGRVACAAGPIRQALDAHAAFGVLHAATAGIAAIADRGVAAAAEIVRFVAELAGAAHADVAVAGANRTFGVIGAGAAIAAGGVTDRCCPTLGAAIVVERIAIDAGSADALGAIRVAGAFAVIRTALAGESGSADRRRRANITAGIIGRVAGAASLGHALVAAAFAVRRAATTGL